MTAYNDPTVLHPAECLRCGTTYRDGDILNQYGECPICEAEREAEEALEAVRDAADDLVIASSSVRRADLLNTIYDITGVR